MLSRSAPRFSARVNPDRTLAGRCTHTCLPTPAVPLAMAISAIWMTSSTGKRTARVRAARWHCQDCCGSAVYWRSPPGRPSPVYPGYLCWCLPPALHCWRCHAAQVPAGWPRGWRRRSGSPAWPALFRRWPASARAGLRVPALATLGFWWLALAESLLRRRLWLGPPAGLPPRAAWESSIDAAATHVIGADVHGRAAAWRGGVGACERDPALARTRPQRRSGRGRGGPLDDRVACRGAVARTGAARARKPAKSARRAAWSGARLCAGDLRARSARPCLGSRQPLAHAPIARGP